MLDITFFSESFINNVLHSFQYYNQVLKNGNLNILQLEKALLHNDANLPLRSSVPYRDISSEFLYTAIPAGLVFILTALVLLGKYLLQGFY